MGDDETNVLTSVGLSTVHSFSLIYHILILQIKKPRLRERESLVQCSPIAKGRAGSPDLPASGPLSDPASSVSWTGNNEIRGMEFPLPL